MPYKSYRFFDSYELRVSWISNGASKSAKKDVVWDEKRTKVISAKLRGRIYASGGTNARLSFNDSEVIFCGAPVVDSTVEDTVDVTGILINGSNICLAEVWKIFYYPFDKIGRFTAELIVEYEGESPEMKAPWEKYLMPALGVASLGVSVAGLAVSLKKEKKEGGK